MEEEHTSVNQLKTLWRDSGLQPQIGGLDARAIFPLVIWMFHWAWETFFIAVGCIAVLFIIQRTGMTPDVCTRFLKTLVIGNRREIATRDEFTLRKRCRW